MTLIVAVSLVRKETHVVYRTIMKTGGNVSCDSRRVKRALEGLDECNTALYFPPGDCSNVRVFG